MGEVRLDSLCNVDFPVKIGSCWKKLCVTIHIEHEVVEKIETPFGIKFIVEGPVAILKGKTATTLYLVH